MKIFKNSLSTVYPVSVILQKCSLTGNKVSQFLQKICLAASASNSFSSVCFCANLPAAENNKAFKNNRYLLLIKLKNFLIITLFMP
jgi:hypothetical protein